MTYICLKSAVSSTRMIRNLLGLPPGLLHITEHSLLRDSKKDLKTVSFTSSITSTALTIEEGWPRSKVLTTLLSGVSPRYLENSVYWDGVVTVT